jgi:hypothetical protein
VTALDVLLRPALLKATYDEVYRDFGVQKGFFALDAVDGRGVWVHVRRHVYDANSAPGIRIGSEADIAEGIRRALSSPDYAIVTVMTAGKRPSTEVFHLLEHEYRSARWLNVEIDSSGVMVRLDATGTRCILMPADHNIDTKPVTTRIADQSIKEVLPVVADVRTTREIIYLPVRTNAVGGPRDQYFQIRRRTAGSLGTFSLRVDVELRSTQADRLLVTSLDETIAVEPVERIPLQESSPVHLHVVFDRTTIDVESWAIAIAAASPKEQLLTESTVPTDDDHPGAWNRRIRTAVAEALPAATEKLRRSVVTTLWTFSDRSRDGIGPSPIGPADGRPWDRIGELNSDSLVSAFVEGRDCEWRPGLDHVDAVDEVLKEVWDYIKLPTNKNKQHVILIIGDSPPPPSGVDDPIWQHLVASPIRTNARRSPLFRDTLSSLREAGVPVGWIFLAWPLRPATSQFDHYHEPYNDVRLLRQRTFDALNLIPGLEMQISLGLEPLGSAVESILTSMVADAPHVSFRGAAYAIR